jgi:carbon storage regulator
VLVLKRKIGESVMIGEEIEVMVLDKEGDTVKIGINAPRSIRVFRKEIFEEIRLANQSATQGLGFEDLIKQFQKETKFDEK